MGAKREPWSSFFTSATPQIVSIAKRFAIGLPAVRFPELPEATTALELKKALLDYFLPRDPAISLNTIRLPFRDRPG